MSLESLDALLRAGWELDYLRGQPELYRMHLRSTEYPYFSVYGRTLQECMEAAQRAARNMAKRESA